MDIIFCGFVQYMMSNSKFHLWFCWPLCLYIIVCAVVLTLLFLLPTPDFPPFQTVITEFLWELGRLYSEKNFTPILAGKKKGGYHVFGLRITDW
jgi:hypothetical protein